MNIGKRRKGRGMDDRSDEWEGIDERNRSGEEEEEKERGWKGYWKIGERDRLGSWNINKYM